MFLSAQAYPGVLVRQRRRRPHTHHRCSLIKRLCHKGELGIFCDMSFYSSLEFPCLNRGTVADNFCLNQHMLHWFLMKLFSSLPSFLGGGGGEGKGNTRYPSLNQPCCCVMDRDTMRDPDPGQPNLPPRKKERKNSYVFRKLDIPCL
jgi:hypothetical protein